MGPPELSVIRNRGVPLFRGSFYTLLYGLLAGTAANVRYREVSAIQGSVIEGFQCIVITIIVNIIKWKQYRTQFKQVKHISYDLYNDSKTISSVRHVCAGVVCMHLVCMECMECTQLCMYI